MWNVTVLLYFIFIEGTKKNMDFIRLEFGFRKAAYFFFAGMVIYIISWAPILWRIIWGIVNYPDEMPNAVWIATLGILIFYDTFILAQCSSISTRIRMILHWRATLASFGVSSSRSLCSVSSMPSCSLVSASTHNSL